MDGAALEKLTRLMGRAAEIAPLPLSLAYPKKGLVKEGVKGLFGAAGCFAIVVFGQPTPWVGWPAGIVGLLFGAYFLQQVSRYYLNLRLEENGLIRELLGFRKTIRWPELARLRLHFYPQAKGSGKGMLVLTLWSGKHRIKLDSTLDHFPALLARAAEAARERGLEHHPTTAENLTHIGLWGGGSSPSPSGSPEKTV